MGVIDNDEAAGMFRDKLDAPKDPIERRVACIYCSEVIFYIDTRRHNLRKHPMAVCIGEGHEAADRGYIEGSLATRLDIEVRICARCGAVFQEPAL